MRVYLFVGPSAAEPRTRPCGSKIPLSSCSLRHIHAKVEEGS
jgi:hypothetical protein